MIGVSTEANAAREKFFRSLFGQAQGLVCIAAMNTSRKFSEEFFEYPNQLSNILNHINNNLNGNNLYFCPQLLKARKRTKSNVSVTTAAWADLDECDPSHLHLEPSIVLETSPNRFQALWCFDRPVDPVDAEDLSKRIAYKHSDQGADRSGWDLTQLLRVPISYNLKHDPYEEVKVISYKANHYRLKDFAEHYPSVAEFSYEDVPYPEEHLEGLTETAEDILQRHRLKINPIAWKLFTEIPAKDWSGPLWQLQMLLCEAGLTAEEVFVVATGAACNKYARDHRRPQLLWKETLRAFNTNEQQTHVVFPKRHQESALLSDEERLYVEATPGFVERYISWAKGLGDAAWQYHQAGAFTCLSSLLCGGVVLPTSFGTIVPNLWFMILADTTLTRKSTAMDIAMDLVMEVDSDLLLATDGSLEGLLGSLAVRPGRPSVFLRDEFSGLLESIVKKDYYAGMAELLTKLYDGKMQKRILRKEVIEVRDPRLIIFAGGIKNRICQLLTFDHVSSGFMPRFIFITAISDITKLKPLGPPTIRDMGNREAIQNELRDIYAHYGTMNTININGGRVATQVPKMFEAQLTDDAWVRYNKCEAEMLTVGTESQKPEIMTPVYDRLAKSALKASVLIAAARQREDKVIVEESDVVHALYYMEGWRTYVQDVMNSVGKGNVERRLDTILGAIQTKGGCSRSQLMQNYHLNAREAEEIFQTLDQRGHITRQKVGRGEMLMPRSGSVSIKGSK